MILNVLSFNILCADAPNGNSIPQRAPRVHAVIQPRHADLIGFQEATPTWLDLLEPGCGKDYEIYNVYRSAQKPESTPIAWKRDRFDCLDRGTLWFSDTPEVESPGWDQLYNCPRIFTWARLAEKTSGGTFCFINTHFGFGNACQTKSAQLLIDFSRRMNCPCVITGDFNMEISSAGYQAMTAFFRDVNACTDNDRGATYHGFDPSLHQEHIDYCFITRDIRPLACKTLREMPGGGYPSDHHCLCAAVAL